MIDKSKVTINDFGTKLAASEYKSAGGARKAVGRFSGWSDKNKAQARNMIDKHFGVVPAAPKVPAKRGPKPKIKAEAAPAKVKRAYVKRGPKAVSGAVGNTAPMFEILGAPTAEPPRHFQAHQLLVQTNLAARTLKRLHAVEPTIAMTETVQLLVNFNNAAMRILGEAMKFVDVAEVVVDSAPVERKVRAAKAAKQQDSAPATPTRGNGKGAIETAFDDDGAIGLSAPQNVVSI